MSLHLNRSRKFGKCAICHQNAKLTGFVCTKCYNEEWKRTHNYVDKRLIKRNSSPCMPPKERAVGIGEGETTLGNIDMVRKV